MSEPAIRLETGPTYRKEGEAQPPSAEAWPTFRGDNRRGGTAQTTLPDTLDEAWKVQLGKDLTQPICVAGMLFVASNEQTVMHWTRRRYGHSNPLALSIHRRATTTAA